MKALLFVLAMALAMVVSGPAVAQKPAGRVLNVGPGQAFDRLAAAVAAARDGDEIRIQAGTYVNDFVHVTRRISIVGVGGMARLVASVPPRNGKAILTTSADLQIRNLEFTGAKVPDRNGGGIRFEGGNLTIVNCYFHRNQTHLLAAAVPDGTITIRNSEFADHVPPDDQAHSLYAGRIARLEIRDSFFHGGINGSNIVKSRALRTLITGSRIYDENGDVSYSIDLPNGGVVTLADNVIVQGPNSPNRAVISYATESAPYPGSSLTVERNVIMSFGRPGPGILNRSGLQPSLSRNKLHGLGVAVLGPSTQKDNEILAAPMPLDRSRPWRAPRRRGLTSGRDRRACWSRRVRSGG